MIGLNRLTRQTERLGLGDEFLPSLQGRLLVLRDGQGLLVEAGAKGGQSHFVPLRRTRDCRAHHLS